MVESLKLFVRTYVYWVGLILGFAVVPGSLLFTAEVAPVNTPLWLAPGRVQLSVYPSFCLKGLMHDE